MIYSPASKSDDMDLQNIIQALGLSEDPKLLELQKILDEYDHNAKKYEAEQESESAKADGNVPSVVDLSTSSNAYMRSQNMKIC